MLVRTIKALCEINIRFDQKLEISGSLHVRSDGDKVMTCLIDEESIKGAQDLSILDAVRFTMPYAAAGLAPMPIPGGFGQQPGLEQLLSPVNTQVTLPNTSTIIDKDKKQAQPPTPKELPSPQLVNILPTEAQREEVVQSHAMDTLAALQSADNKIPGVQMTEAEAALLLQRRLSNEVLPRVSQQELGTKPVEVSRSSSRSGKHAHNHSSAPSQGAQGDSSSPQQNHVKLPNIQTFTGMLPRLPQQAPLQQPPPQLQLHQGQGVKPESKGEASSPLPNMNAGEDLASFPTSATTPNQTPTTQPGGFPPSPLDPLVGVKVEMQSQVDAEGNVVQKKKFQCMFCGIFLSTKCYLKNHINAMHTKARVYPCEVCEKYFYSAGALRIHKLRNHWQGSKKHKCQHCGETFLLPIELRKHILKKHGDTVEEMEMSTPNGNRNEATGPSSGGSSPRQAAMDRPAFPAALMANPAMLHGPHVFPNPLLSAHPAGLEKLVAASLASGAISVDTNSEVSVAHSAPVFPSPVRESIADGSMVEDEPTLTATKAAE